VAQYVVSADQVNCFAMKLALISVSRAGLRSKSAPFRYKNISAESIFLTVPTISSWKLRLEPKAQRLLYRWFDARCDM